MNAKLYTVIFDTIASNTELNLYQISHLTKKIIGNLEYVMKSEGEE